MDFIVFSEGVARFSSESTREACLFKIFHFKSNTLSFNFVSFSILNCVSRFIMIFPELSAVSWISTVKRVLVVVGFKLNRHTISQSEFSIGNSTSYSTTSGTIMLIHLIKF